MVNPRSKLYEKTHNSSSLQSLKSEYQISLDILGIGYLTLTHDSLGMKLKTRFRISSSHSKEHKLKHNICECVKNFCSSENGVEQITYLSLHCANFTI